MTCFYQIFEQPKGLRMHGWGDCSVCAPDDKNKECRGYIRISINYFNVKEAGNDQTRTEARAPTEAESEIKEDKDHAGNG